MQKIARNLLMALTLALGIGTAAAPLGGGHHANAVETASSAASTASPNDLSWG